MTRSERAENSGDATAHEPVGSLEGRCRTLYVAGRGHSGSTFLDVLLGNADGVESLGEILSGLNRGPNESCSCGLSVRECPFWRSVYATYRAEFHSEISDDGAWLFSVSDVRLFPSAWFGSLEAHRIWGQYARLNRQLLSALSRITGSSVIVDSNKEYTRALMLLRSMEDVRVVHLIRDPVAIVGSYYYRQEKGLPFKFLKREFHPGLARFPALMIAALGWSGGMLLGALLKLRFPERVLHLSYERLCEDPATELRRLGEFAGLDLTDVIHGVEQRRPFPVGHNIGGNELRHEREFTFIPNVSGRRTIPWYYRLGARILTAPGRMIRILMER